MAGEMNPSEIFRPQPQGNPFGVMTEMMQMQQGMNQNLLFQQQFKARRAIGGIMQQAIDPHTGAIDYNKAAIMLSTDPDAGFLAPDIINGWIQRQEVQQHIIGATLDNASKRYGAIGNEASALVSAGHANGDKVSKADLSDRLHMLIGMGAIDTDTAMNFLTSMPDDPRGIYAGLLKTAQATQGASQSLSNTFKQLDIPTTTQGGVPRTLRGTQSMYGGGFSQFGAQGPETPAGPGMGVTAPAEEQGAGGAAQSGPAVVNGAQGASRQETTGGGPQPSGGGAPAPDIGNVRTGLSPFEQKRQDDVAEYAKDLGNRQQVVSDTYVQLHQAEDALSRVKTGGGAEDYKRLAMVMQALGADKDTYEKVANGSLTDTQYLEKIFMGLGTSRIASLIHQAGGRLAQQEWAQYLARGTPTIEMTPQAIRKIFNSIKEMGGYTRAEAAGFGQFQRGVANGTLDASLGDWQTEYWPKAMDMLLAKRKSPNAPAQTPNAPSVAPAAGATGGY